MHSCGTLHPVGHQLRVTNSNHISCQAFCGTAFRCKVEEDTLQCTLKKDVRSLLEELAMFWTMHLQDIKQAATFVAA